jgi:hypothetical protein
MNVYYFLFEGEPSLDNEESKDTAGAYINCWVNSEDEVTAKDKAIDYIFNQGWEKLNLEETYIAAREWYLDEPDSLECFEEALNCGIGAIFYTWSIDTGE